MKKPLLARLLSVFLAALMLFGTMTIVIPAAADDTETPEAEDSGKTPYRGYYDGFTKLEDVEKYLGIDPYLDYQDKYADVPRAKEQIVLNAWEYDADQTTAEVEVRNAGEFGCDSKFLYMPDEGKTSWTFTVPEDGMYCISINYYSPEGTFTTIERMLYVDGKLPFSEASYFYFPRSWEYEYDSYDENGNPLFSTDVNGNDIRPRRNEKPKWVDYYLRDWLGYTMEPFEFYFKAGTHTITFEAAREPIAISTIRLYPYAADITYEEFLANCKAQGITEATGVDPIVIEAENPETVSNACLFPANDRTSSLTTPQDPSVIRYNMLDTSVVNHWMNYKVTVPKAGLYYIACRQRQNSLIGMFSSRRLYVNGEVQFDEASHIRFPYDPEWQTRLLSDGSDINGDGKYNQKEDGFLFYLKEGENDLRIEVVLGDMTEYVYQIEQMVTRLNAAYQKILLITGPTPDAYREYNFNRIAPDAIKTIGAAADELFAMAEELQEVTGELGDQVATLNTVGLLFELMAEDEYEIAPNLITFKNYIIVLSNWLYSSLSQPLKVDKYVILGTDDLKHIPQGKANFFQAAFFEIKAFIQSFFMDYTTIGFKSDAAVDPSTSVELWIVSAAGREDALIQRHLIDNYFTPETGIGVTIKVITAGLTEAILAGIGPDLAGMGSNDTITWGMRNAISKLSYSWTQEDYDNGVITDASQIGQRKFAGFDEVMTWFDPAATQPLTMDGITYGIPQAMSFPMMFYRTDVLAEYKLDAPQTWTELEEVILPALMKGHLEVGFPTALGGLNIFLYQMDTTLYSMEEGHEGWKINLDSNTALAAFEKLTNMFTKYKSPVSYDITRFRTGEIPIIIADAIGTYNTLMGFYELRGLWEMAPLPGIETVDENGKITSVNRTSIVTVTSYVIPRGANNEQSSWEYIKWMVSEDMQLRLAKEQLNVAANPTTKYNTPNINALKRLAWTDKELEAISTQLNELASVPEYPGNYIVGVYVANAFNTVYNTNSKPHNAMLDRILEINKEISRKRKEFKLDYYEISYNAAGEDNDEK